jgi:hypothetical protein
VLEADDKLILRVLGRCKSYLGRKVIEKRFKPSLSSRSVGKIRGARSWDVTMERLSAAREAPGLLCNLQRISGRISPKKRLLLPSQPDSATPSDLYQISRNAARL